jgi:hypothetical protein
MSKPRQNSARGQRGKVAVKKTITRGGKTFQQTFYISPQEAKAFQRKKAIDSFERGGHEVLHKLSSQKKKKKKQEQKKEKRADHSDPSGTEHLFHVTHFNRLGDVARQGLRAGSRGSMGAAGLQKYKKGHIFATEADGISFWHGRSDDYGYSNTDDQKGEGAFPVILRFPEPEDFENNWFDDRIGSRDAKATAYMGKSSVNADDLEVFFAGAWYPVSRWTELDADSAFDDQGYMFYDSKNPFYWEPK